MDWLATIKEVEGEALLQSIKPRDVGPDRLRYLTGLSLRLVTRIEQNLLIIVDY